MDFSRARDEAFDRVIAAIGDRQRAATPVIILQTRDKSPENLKANAEKDVWTLLGNGIRHLKDGAPDGKPGAMAEALSRASLRASPFAAALGVPPPQFEPVYFSVDYATGDEAALFLCQRLIDGAAEDFPRSRLVIQQKILAEKPAAELKEQMAMAFDVLAETYALGCKEIKEKLAGF